MVFAPLAQHSDYTDASRGTTKSGAISSPERSVDRWQSGALDHQVRGVFRDVDRTSQLSASSRCGSRSTSTSMSGAFLCDSAVVWCAVADSRIGRLVWRHCLQCCVPHTRDRRAHGDRGRPAADCALGTSSRIRTNSPRACNGSACRIDDRLVAEVPTLSCGRHRSFVSSGAGGRSVALRRRSELASGDTGRFYSANRSFTGPKILVTVASGNRISTSLWHRANCRPGQRDPPLPHYGPAFLIGSWKSSSGIPTQQG